jgi:5-methylcytosine-specific restriction endonuclease McrA
MPNALVGLSNAQLLDHVRDLVRRGNSVEAELLAHLGEVDARKIYLDQACSSMFAYCRRVLHFSEAVAYKRIQAARAARRHQQILAAVRSGDLHLSAVSLLSPKLTSENCAELIAAARHRGTDEIKQMLADRAPKPDVPTAVRPIASPVNASEQAPLAPAQVRTVPPAPSLQPAAPPLITKPRTEPLGAERYSVKFTIDRETHAQLEELRALMRHQVPDGDVGKILARAVALLLKQVRRQKFAETPTPRSARTGMPTSERASRHIPAAIRRAVWERDAGCCTYVSDGGRRCNAREFIEFDHVEAWVWTHSHPIDGITLRCRAHNQHRARQDFGEKHMARFKRTGFKSSSAVEPGYTREIEQVCPDGAHPAEPTSLLQL